MNQYCYAPIDMSRDYPEASGITHELGHGFGLKHGPDRTVEGVEFQTIMAQSIDWITTYDLGHLLTYYYSGHVTEQAALATHDWVVSDKIRYYDGAGVLVKGEFATFNPTDLYMDTSVWRFMDMSTAPYDLNNGSALACFEVATEKTGWVYDCIFAENISTVTINGDLTQGLLTSVNPLYSGLWINQGTFVNWPMSGSVPGKVRFNLDFYDDYAERSEDNNTVEMDITLHSDVSVCP